MSSRRKTRQEAGRLQGGSDVAVTVLASVAIALPLLFYLRQHVEILRYGYEIESLRERRAALVERTRELSAQRLESASLERVAEQAPSLGLVAPEPDHVLVATTGVGEVARQEPAGRMTARLE
jgi:hypothetical protein